MRGLLLYNKKLKLNQDTIQKKISDAYKAIDRLKKNLIIDEVEF